MAIKYELIGKIFGRLTVIKFNHSVPKEGNWWQCKCRCGNVVLKPTYVLMRGKKQNTRQSCGSCNDALKYPSEYNIWRSMHARCYNKNETYYHRYGGRGITVCQHWRVDFFNFLDDMGHRPEEKSINRINNDGNYEKNNCKWSTIEEQNDTKTQRNGKYNLKLINKWDKNAIH
jgi:hypothetical protein